MDIKLGRYVQDFPSSLGWNNPGDIITSDSVEEALRSLDTEGVRVSGIKKNLETVTSLIEEFDEVRVLRAVCLTSYIKGSNSYSRHGIFVRHGKEWREVILEKEYPMLP